MTITDLIARLEAAEEGSSELDWQIYLTATERGRWEHALPAETLKLPWPKWIENYPVAMRLPHYTDGGNRPYTRSLDSAKTLFPEPPEMIPSNPRKACIAALRAIQAQKEREAQS